MKETFKWLFFDKLSRGARLVFCVWVALAALLFLGFLPVIWTKPDVWSPLQTAMVAVMMFLLTLVAYGICRENS